MLFWVVVLIKKTGAISCPGYEVLDLLRCHGILYFKFLGFSSTSKSQSCQFQFPYFACPFPQVF